MKKKKKSLWQIAFHIERKKEKKGTLKLDQAYFTNKSLVYAYFL